MSIRLTEAGRDLKAPACQVSAAMIDALDMDQGEFAALKTQLQIVTERVNATEVVAAPEPAA